MEPWEPATGRPAWPEPAAPRLPLRRVVGAFRPYLRPYQGRAAAVLAASLLAPALETSTIYLFKLLVDRVLVPRDLHPFATIAALYLALTAASGILGFATEYLSTSISERFLLDLRTNVFAHLHRLSLDFLDRSRLGDLLSRLTSDVSAIESFLLSGAVDAAVHALRVVFFAAALFWLEWRLALLALAVAPIFWLAARRLSGRLRELSREKRRRAGALSAVAEESLSGAALVRAYGAEALEVRRFSQEGRAALQAQMQTAKLRSLFAPLVDMLEVGGNLLVVAAGTWELARGRLTLGGLLVFVTYLGKLYRPVRGLASFTNTAFSAAASAERVLELLDQPPEIGSGSPRRERPRPVRGLLEFERVGFRYPGAPAPALKDISFRVAPGEVLALVGPSGAGKSTVVKLLLRFHDPSEGRILLDGRDLRELPVTEVRAAIAVVLQETLVLHASVRENIAYARPEATDAEVEGAARAADAHEFIAALPGGYDCVVGQKGRLLSGGQRQRLAIARAILRNAPMLLLDEPTAGLDSASERRIILPMLRLLEGRTALMVTHDLALAGLATRVLVLESGRAAQEGTPAELRSRPGPYSWTYQLQQAGSGESAPEA
jgi:ATP-binding cassette, subfamily B, bacterial